MFTNAGNSEFSRDFYVQTDFDKTALDDIYGRPIELKKTSFVFIAAQANASATDIFARTRLCGWRARAQGSGGITFTRVSNQISNIGCLLQRQVFATDEAATGSVMDAASGLFTAGRAGIYKVSCCQIFGFGF